MFTAVLWGIFTCCALLAANGFWRIAREPGSRRHAGSWHAPLIFTSASAALLAVLGALALTAGAFLALIPLVIIMMIVAGAWRSAAKALGGPKATALVLRGLAARLRDALQGAWTDLRVLAGRPPGCADPAAGAVEDGPGSAPGRPRRTPSVWNDPGLGPVPVPAQVADGLMGANVIVPPAWAVVAEGIADFEAEDGEDLRLHIAENAAGILTVFGALEGQVEMLAEGDGLDPSFISAYMEFAEDLADTASSAAMALRAYDRAYEGVHEHVDSGGTLPRRDARTWFGADDVPGGQAA